MFKKDSNPKQKPLKSVTVTEKKHIDHTKKPTSKPPDLSKKYPKGFIGNDK